MRQLRQPRFFLEDHPAFEGALTGRLARRLVADAKVMTFSAAARRHGVHWHAVLRALVDVWSALVAERRRSRRCSVLLVDETSMRKRHRYVTVIVNGDTGRTLAMVEHRSSAALSAFLMQQGHRWCKQVKVVVSDGSRAYKAAIDAHLGHARHVLDRFHVIRWFAAGLTQVPICTSRATCADGATSSAESQVDLSARAGRRGAKASSPPSTPRCSEPGSRCCAEATPSPTPTAPASTSCSTPTPASKPAGRRGRLARWQLQELHGLYTADDYRRRPRRPRAVLRPLRDRRAARVPQHRRHVHRMVRRDPQLAPHRPPLQRQNRGHPNQPAECSKSRPPCDAHRPRNTFGHQPTQLRSPRHPLQVTHNQARGNRCQQPSIPRIREGPKTCGRGGVLGTDEAISSPRCRFRPHRGSIRARSLNVGHFGGQTRGTVSSAAPPKAPSARNWSMRSSS